MKCVHAKIAPSWLGWCAIMLLSVSIRSEANDHDVVGPLVGSVGTTTAQLLFRPGETDQTLRLSVLTPDGLLVAMDETKSEAGTDYVAKFHVDGLAPSAKYLYCIESISDTPTTLVEANEQHSFTTASAARTGHSVTVGFVSCVDIEPSDIWSEMESLGVDALCLMGDTPYIDDSNLDVVRKRHRQFLQMPELASMAMRTSTFGTWDDHDFGLNNGNGLNMMDGKPNTRRGFVEYRAHSQYGDGSEGVYHQVDLGMIEIFLLDPRYFSQTRPSPVDPKQTTCFGTKQWQWLLKGLKASQAPFKILLTGSIWQDKKNKEIDDMFTYWYERDALLDFIADEQITGVALMGGDIHVARHLIHPQRVGYDLHDFVISPGHSRTITGLDVYHPSLEWSLVEGWQFLTLTADGTGESAKLIAEYRQPNGKVNRRVVIKHNDMIPTQDKVASDALRAVWRFDGSWRNDSVLGDRVDMVPHNGAVIVNGQTLRLQRDQQQYVTVPRSFLDDNSDAHTLSLRFRPETLPEHGSDERMFLFESTAEGDVSSIPAWHLSLGLRSSTDDPAKVNLQLYTHTLEPAESQKAPSAISQGPFDFLVDRETILDRWTQVAVTFDSKSIDLFVDGDRVASNRLPIPGPASEFGGLVIGGHREGVGRNFDGWIDDVLVWARVQNQPQRSP